MVDEMPAAIADVLDAERDTLNHRFRLRLASGARIDALAFLEHIRQDLVPLAVLAHSQFPERLRNFIVSLYDVSLDLFTASYLGPEAKSPWVARVWRELLPTMPILLVREPQRVAGSLCNAVVHLANQVGARPNEWLERMTDAAKHCTSASELLLAGRVAAWQTGMVQYRDAALSAARELPLPIATAVCGLLTSPTQDEWQAALERLSSNRWLSITEALQQTIPPEIRCVGIAGAFRGFGGSFLQPPLVDSHEGRLFARDRTAACMPIC